MMKAAYLVKYGKADKAFELREASIPVPSASQVLIRVEAFGLNFADVMARLGLYKGAPPVPTILGYDVVGYIEQCGADISHVQIGDRVTAMVRFGGYAEYAVAEGKVTHKVPEEFSAGVAAALATQYSMAYFLAHEMANLQKHDHILIQAAAGGVGTGLVQLARHRGCVIFGTCSSPEKMEYLRESGVQYPINYAREDFSSAVRKVMGTRGLDVVFDPVGGKSFRKGFRLLGTGGRMISYGVSAMNQTKSVFGKLRVLAQFGIYHPVQLLSQARGLIGVYLLKIGDERPDKVERVMKQVVEMTRKEILHPYVGGEYPIDQLAEAHQFLESRKSMGKIVIKW
jgi:NADPH:quinone reductase-like Zn-dependent oxidoreductase